MTIAPLVWLLSSTTAYPCVHKPPAFTEKDWLASELDAEADEILARGLAVGMFFKKRGIRFGSEKRKKP